jgi:branched-chain amino acid transport system substrate-binding protein
VGVIVGARAERERVIVLAEAISPKIRDAGDYTFRIQPDGAHYIRALAPFAYHTLKLRRVATMYVNNDFGVSLAATFKAEFEKLGGRVVLENGFEQNQTDFRALLALAQAERPDGIFAPAYTEVGQMLKQAHELGFHPQFLGASPFENPDILAIAGYAAEGVVYPHHFDSESADPAILAYQTRYRRRFGHPSEGLAVLAYDGLKIITPALSRCSSDTDCIKDYLYGLKGYIGVTGPTSFDSQGDILKPILIKWVHGGRFETYPRTPAASDRAA